MPSPEGSALSFRFALAVASVLLAGTSLAEPAGTFSTSRFVTDHPELATTPLERGRRVTAAIHGAEVHRYTVDLRRGQFAAVRLEQLGGDLVLTVFDPAGRLIDIRDGNSTGAVDVATLFVETTGRYAFQVAVFDWTTAEAAYAVTLVRRERAGRRPEQKAAQLFASWYDRDSPGAAVVVERQGRVVFRRARGLAQVESRKAITPKTAVDLASVSKQFTGYAVALLVERGSLRFDDDIRRYLPELPDYGHRITVQHLLEHTSGLRDWDGLLRLAGRNIEDGIGIDEVVALAARQRGVHFAPGHEQRYSNTGYVLLAKIVERVTGQPFAVWTAEHVFRPLALESCSFGATVGAPRAFSYRKRVPRPVLFSREPTLTFGSSSLECSADDLRRWLAHLRHGAPQGVRAPLPNPTGPAGDYGFGNWFDAREGRAWFGHKGLAAGFRTAVRTYPGEELSIVFLANDADDDTYRRAAVLEDLFLGLVPRPVEVPEGEFTPPPPPPAMSISPFLGVYESEEAATSYRVVERAGALALEHEHNGTIPLVALGGDDFRSDAWFVPALSFLRAANGPPTGFRVNLPDGAGIEFRRRSAGTAAGGGEADKLPE